ncbi:MAG: twin-arginine translocation signal domain-containing protein, partial [Verrucomicrobiales bacterium]
MKLILPASDMSFLTRRDVSRRDVLRTLGATALGAALGGFPKLHAADAAAKDSLTMQFYKSLTEEQHAAICLPVDHPKRQFVSNWWYICPEQRLHTFYTKDQQDLVKQIFESLHSPEYREKMDWQVQKDLMGNIKNTPSVGFFGTPADKD